MTEHKEGCTCKKCVEEYNNSFATISDTVENYHNQQEAPPACPHKEYCPADCGECDSDALDAAKAILERRGRYYGRP